jgi:hypothetical protein
MLKLEPDTPFPADTETKVIGITLTRGRAHEKKASKPVNPQ